jgi:glutaredoxin
MTKKKVEIYSTPTCHFCHLAKEFFQEHNIEYIEYDVASDVEKRIQMMQETGQLGVPVIVISGDTPEDTQIMIGFNEAVLRDILEV